MQRMEKKDLKMDLKMETYETHWYNKLLCNFGLHHWDFIGDVPTLGPTSKIEFTDRVPDEVPMWQCRHCRVYTINEPGKPI